MTMKTNQQSKEQTVKELAAWVAGSRDCTNNKTTHSHLSDKDTRKDYFDGFIMQACVPKVKK
jgi:hypothetical protein